MKFVKEHARALKAIAAIIAITSALNFGWWFSHPRTITKWKALTFHTTKETYHFCRFDGSLLGISCDKGITDK